VRTTLCRGQQQLASNIVLIDGFSGSGKALIGGFFGHLHRAEQWQVDDVYEYLAILNYIGELSTESLSALLKTKSDKALYNLRIGRNVNFRPSDLSSPFNDDLHEKYLKRLTSCEGQPVVDDIRASDPILPLNIHFIFGYSDALLTGFGDRLKLYILMLRHPLALIEAWHCGGWVRRVGSDSREFNLCIAHGKFRLPWYAREYASLYLSATDMERAILTVRELYVRCFAMYRALDLDLKRKVLPICFEDFVSHPEAYVDNICHRLNTVRAPSFGSRLSSLMGNRVREEPTDWFAFFSNKYRLELTSAYRGMILDLIDSYEKFRNEVRMFTD